METQIFTKDQLEKAAALLRKGELVAFPTETVYGLGADALNEDAVLKIFAAKGRPADNPLIVHVKSPEDVDEIAYTKGFFNRLAEAFWPGPLTLVLPKKDIVPYVVTGGLETVAVRMPQNDLALGLIEKAQTPLAGPSANTSGRPSPTEAGHVLSDMKGRIAGILDGGKTGLGLESTVLDLSGDVPVILRPGGVTLEMLKGALGDVREALPEKGGPVTVRSPGQKYRHYAPKAQLYRVFGEPKEQKELILEQIKKHPAKKIGVLATSEFYPDYPVESKFDLGSRESPQSIAANLYGALRYFDDTDAEYILAETVPGKGLYTAIDDRLTRASCGKTLVDFLQDIGQ